MPVSRIERVRQHRERKKQGWAVLQIEVPVGPLADALVEAKLLAEWNCENKEEIEKAVEFVLISMIDEG